MREKIEEFLPTSEDDEFTILVKNNAIGNLNYMGVNLEKVGNLATIYQEYEKLKESNNGDQSYHIVTSNFARKYYSGNGYFSHDEIATLVNDTDKKLGLGSSKLLTKDEIMEQLNEKELAKAKELGFIKTPEDIINTHLPKEDTEHFSIIAKHKAINNKNEMSVVDPNTGNLEASKKLLSILNKQNNGDWEYYIVTPSLANNLSTLSLSVLGETVNQTQNMLGLDSKLEFKAEPQPQSNKPIVKEVKENNEVDNILQTLDATVEDNQTPTVQPEAAVAQEPPKPSQVAQGLNFGPIGEHLKSFNEQQTNHTVPMTTKKKVLYGLGATLSVMVVPAIYLIPACIILAQVMKKKSLKDPAKIWEKRQELLIDATMDVQGIKKSQRSSFQKNNKVGDILFTPEIASRYEELHSKVYKESRDNGLHPKINKSIGDFRSKQTDESPENGRKYKR